LEVYVEINCLCCIQGRLVVAGGDLGDLWVWDLTAEGPKREEGGERRPREGEVGNEEGEGEGKMVLNPIRVLKHSQNPIFSVLSIPGRPYFLSSGGLTVKIWSSENFECISELDIPKIPDFAS
jgi:WD40 repeat protein